jgi:hypothetical protein
MGEVGFLSAVANLQPADTGDAGMFLADIASTGTNLHIVFDEKAAIAKLISKE